MCELCTPTRPHTQKGLTLVLMLRVCHLEVLNNFIFEHLSVCQQGLMGATCVWAEELKATYVRRSLHIAFLTSSSGVLKANPRWPLGLWFSGGRGGSGEGLTFWRGYTFHSKWNFLSMQEEGNGQGSPSCPYTCYFPVSAYQTTTSAENDDLDGKGRLRPPTAPSLFISLLINKLKAENVGRICVYPLRNKNSWVSFV